METREAIIKSGEFDGCIVEAFYKNRGTHQELYFDGGDNEYVRLSQFEFVWKDEFEKELNEKADWWNKNYPVGSKVLFHGDGKSVSEIRIIKAPIFVANNSYLGIFMEDVSGYYHLADAFVRPYNGNEHLLCKSLKDDVS